MARKLKSDKPLFLTTMALLFSSLVMVYSASAVLAMDRFSQPYYFLFRQMTWVALGGCVLAFVMRIDYRLLRKPFIVLTLLSVTFLMLIAVLFGPPINGTRRWFGIAGFGIQPSEFAKIAVIIFTAAILERRMDRVNELSYSLLPIGLVTGGIAGLVLLGPDFSTAFTMFVIVGAIVFSAGLSYRYLIGLALVSIPTIYFVIATSNYRRRRFLGFLDPWADPLGDGYQIMQSLIAVGTGGLFGKGLMGGVQKLFYLPEPHTDFIYAVIAEETGLVGATLVLLCFVMIIWRGLRVTLRAPDRFGAFLAIGITTMVASQAFMNISVVLSLMPTTGLPLPFLSSGGSSLLVSSIAMGVLLNISQHASVET